MKSKDFSKEDHNLSRCFLQRHTRMNICRKLSIFHSVIGEIVWKAGWGVVWGQCGAPCGERVVFLWLLAYLGVWGS
jgi:hypothetical protein